MPGNKDEDNIENAYQIRPPLDRKFRSSTVKSIIQNILEEELAGKKYDAASASTWSKNMADAIKHKIKGLNYLRYKILVQVVIGEMRGEGVRVATKCLWDADTDNYASYTYLNDSLFCVGVAYGVYYY